MTLLEMIERCAGRLEAMRLPVREGEALRTCAGVAADLRMCAAVLRTPPAAAPETEPETAPEAPGAEPETPEDIPEEGLRTEE